MLWYEVKALLGLTENFFDRNIFMGINVNDEDESVRINTIIMLTNQFIWKFRDKQECLTRARLRRHFSDYLLIEKYIAQLTERETIFTNQWEELFESLR